MKLPADRDRKNERPHCSRVAERKGYRTPVAPAIPEDPAMQLKMASQPCREDPPQHTGELNLGTHHPDACALLTPTVVRPK